MTYFDMAYSALPLQGIKFKLRFFLFCFPFMHFEKTILPLLSSSYFVKNHLGILYAVWGPLFPSIALCVYLSASTAVLITIAVS